MQVIRRSNGKEKLRWREGGGGGKLSLIIDRIFKVVIRIKRKIS